MEGVRGSGVQESTKPPKTRYIHMLLTENSFLVKRFFEAKSAGRSRTTHEYGTSKTVTARFWHRRSGGTLYSTQVVWESRLLTGCAPWRASAWRCRAATAGRRMTTYECGTYRTFTHLLRVGMGGTFNSVWPRPPTPSPTWVVRV